MRRTKNETRNDMRKHLAFTMSNDNNYNPDRLYLDRLMEDFDRHFSGNLE